MEDAAPTAPDPPPGSLDGVASVSKLGRTKIYVSISRREALHGIMRPTSLPTLLPHPSSASDHCLRPPSASKQSRPLRLHHLLLAAVVAFVAEP